MAKRPRIDVTYHKQKHLELRERGFSLIDQGVIVPGETVTEVPILSVNARNDYVAPEFDMELANNSTRDGTIIYSGSDDHCPQDRFTVMPQIADWLEAKLAPGKK